MPTTFRVPGNRLTGNFNTMKFSESVTVIDVSRNFLQPFSNLPADITALDLGFNKFTGSIPRGLTSLPQLQYLDLGANALTGPIPTFCQEGQQLSFLNLASNALSGPPTPLSSPSCSASLASLKLASNRLSGPIPATISSFTNLERLRLDKNALTGAIPAAGIQQVLMAGNQLSGAVPAALSKLKRGSFKPGNPDLCGTPLPAYA
ncbi:unnamed protein product [Closterium sp. NIES-65]|nr:unnamed protein product [Closterium sp. NIES-65]